MRKVRCDYHSRTYFEREYAYYYSGTRIGSGRSHAIGESIAFDIDFLYSDISRHPPWIFGRHYVQLIENGGPRFFGFEVGFDTVNAFNNELHCSDMPRPPTHRSMIAAISAQGGGLQYVEIDDFHASTKIYEAKLHIRQANRDVVVDIRPSDAMVLALIADAPITVSAHVLQRMKGNQPVPPENSRE